MEAIKIFTSLLLAVLLYCIFYGIISLSVPNYNLVRPTDKKDNNIELTVEGNRQVFTQDDKELYTITFEANNDFINGISKKLIFDKSPYTIESFTRKSIYPFYNYNRKVTDDTYVVYLEELLKKKEKVKNSGLNSEIIKDIILLSRNNLFESKVFNSYPSILRVVSGPIQFVALFFFLYLFIHLLTRDKFIVKKEEHIRDTENFPNLRDQVSKNNFNIEYEDLKAKHNSQPNSIYLKLLKYSTDLMALKKRNNEIIPVLSNLFQIEKNKIQSDYLLCNYLVWVLPIIGFVGTIIGISGSMGQTGGMKNPDSLIQLESNFNITRSLFTAFDTTLFSLILYGLSYKLVTFYFKKENNSLAKTWDKVIDFVSLSRTELNDLIESNEQEGKEIRKRLLADIDDKTRSIELLNLEKEFIKAKQDILKDEVESLKKQL